jgi:hypothetical protein
MPPCHWSDLTDWSANFSHLKYVMPLLVLALPAMGYLLAGTYLPIQEAWLPAHTTARRRSISALAVGIICLGYSLAAGWIREFFYHPELPSPHRFLITSSFSMLLFAGAAPRLHQNRLFPEGSGPRPFPLAAWLLPLPLIALACLVCQRDFVFRWVKSLPAAISKPLG